MTAMAGTIFNNISSSVIGQQSVAALICRVETFFVNKYLKFTGVLCPFSTGVVRLFCSFGG